MTVSPGFGPMDLGQIAINGVPLSSNYRLAVNNLLLQRTNNGSSLLTLQLTDPQRTILKSLSAEVQATQRGPLQGAIIIVDGLSYTLTQYVKASDQVQMIFESSGIYQLRGQRGKKSAGTGNKYITPFMKSMVFAIKGMNWVGPDFATTLPQLLALRANSGLPVSNWPPFQVGRGVGATSDENEDSWTCLTRLASTIGWRLWESQNTIYCGPDEYWLGLLPGQNGKPPINVAMSGGKIPELYEFTRQVQLMDFDWNIHKPLGQMSVTCMLDSFSYTVGQIVHVNNMGPANGKWMVSSMQRNLFLPTASMALTVPMPLGTYISPTSLPLQPFPLQ